MFPSSQRTPVNSLLTSVRSKRKYGAEVQAIPESKRDQQPSWSMGTPQNSAALQAVWHVSPDIEVETFSTVKAALADDEQRPMINHPSFLAIQGGCLWRLPVRLPVIVAAFHFVDHLSLEAWISTT